MREVPYQSNSGNACALACYTMVAQYLLPDAGITFDKLSQIAQWRKGYVVWEFPVWIWLMDRGISISDYDNIDYARWAKEGVSGLRASIPEQEFAWYEANTYDLNDVTRHIQKAFAHPSLTYVRRKPTWDDILAESTKPGICDIVLNSRALNKQPGFAAHRVVLIDISDNMVTFHDPNHDGSGKYRRETIDHFRHAFEATESPALARYSTTE